MSRVKRGILRTKKRSKLKKLTKGMKWGRKNLTRHMKPAARRAGVHAFIGRKSRKTDFRRLWQIRIGAAAKMHGLSYSKFMGLLKKANIMLDRKILADLAANHKKIFAEVVKSVSSVK